jgi:hypothetical protein
MKTVNTSIKKKTKKKAANNENSPWWEYKQQGTWRMLPYNIETLKRLATELRSWADKDTSLRINDFYNEHGIHCQTYYEMMGRCEELKEAHDYTLERISSRREIGAITRKYDSVSIYKTLGFYDAVYRSEQKRAAELKLEAEKADMNRKLTLELEIVEKTGLVKPLEKK